MIDYLLEFVQSFTGLTSVLLTMLLEGLSLPIPGIIVVLLYGYYAELSYLALIWIAALMSIVYTLASLIPYYIGLKSERWVPKKIKKSFAFFERWGSWSIAISRPFTVGNYISFVAGISRVPILKYCIFTFIGIYPWAYITTKVGEYFKGSYEAILDILGDYTFVIIGLTILVTILPFILPMIWREKEE